MALYEHGITSLQGANFISSLNKVGAFWSATTSAQDTTTADFMILALGTTYAVPKTGNYYAICVK